MVLMCFAYFADSIIIVVLTYLVAVGGSVAHILWHSVLVS
jgi:hypothetical protein